MYNVDVWPSCGHRTGHASSLGEGVIHFHILGELKLALPLRLDLILALCYASHMGQGFIVPLGQGVAPACGRRDSERHACMTMPETTVELFHSVRLLAEADHTHILGSSGSLRSLPFLPCRILLHSILSSCIYQASVLLLCLLLYVYPRRELFLSCGDAGIFYETFC